MPCYQGTGLGCPVALLAGFPSKVTGDSGTGVTGVKEETVTISRIVVEDPGGEVDKEDDEGTEDDTEIWQITHVTEEELETTEGEEVDLLSVLLELTDWEVYDKD